MNLTKTQIQRSNKVMFTIIIIICTALIALNIMAATMKVASPIICYSLVGMYLTEIVLVALLWKFRGEKMTTVYFIGILWVVSASIAVFFTMVIMTYVTSFVVAATSVVYMDKKLLYVMNLGSLIGLLPAIVVQHFMVPELVANGIFIVGITSVLAVGMTMVGRLFIAFSDENRQELNQKIATQSETMQNISQTTESVNAIFSRIVSNLDVINEQIEQNKNSMDSVSQSMQSTAIEIQNQANATSNIQQIIKLTEERTQKVSETSENVLCIVEEGISISKEVQQQSVVVDQNTGMMSDTIKTLLKHVDDVSAIAESIIAISSETNLLALNASIEAARAGEAGKGFAVVADQIRILSENTRNSISKISDIVKELGDASKNTMQTLKESMISIQIQSENADKISEHFIETGKAMNLLDELLISMRQDVNTLYTSNNSIVEGVETLSANTEETSAISIEGVNISDQIIEKMRVFNKEVEEMNAIIGNLSETMQG